MRAMDVGRSLISIKSNGSLVTPERLTELKALGLDIVTISLDSGIPGEHDAFRGMKGAWEKAVRAVKLCQEAGVGVMLACTVSRENAGGAGVEKLIELAREWDVLLLLILAAPSGNWQGRHDLLMTEAQMDWLRATLRKRSHVRTDFDANWVRPGCGAMKEILYISQYGDVMACPFIQVSFGNVLREPLEVIWNRGIRAPYFRDYAGKCLIGEDPEFIRQYSRAIAAEKELPVSLEKFESADSAPYTANR
ncbi:MAG: radical SAM protein [Bdellovibrionales bacterium]|nr:radical SAM protein [Bdellovibrionales bacterium]